MVQYRIADFWHTHVSQFSLSYPSDRTIVAWITEEISEAHMRTRKIFISTILAGIYHVFSIACASGMIKKIWFLHREDRKKKSKSIPTPSSWHSFTQKHWDMPQARGDSLLKLTANRKALIHRASEQAEFAKTMVIGQFFLPMNLLRMETVLLLYAENTQGWGIIQTVVLFFYAENTQCQ